MADDDLQKEHAANLSAERHMMQAWNTTRQIARARLHDFRTQQAAQTPRQQAQPANDAKPVPPAPTIESTTQQFQPRPFTLGDPVAPLIDANAGAGGGVSVPLKDIIVVLNGTAYYTNILTDGRLDPV